MSYESCKALVIEKPRNAVIKTIPLPAVDEKSVVIRTTWSAISTGTEVKVWNGKTGKLGGELWYPAIPGYEQVGVVEHVGKDAFTDVRGRPFHVGQRVMANEVRRYPEPYCGAWGGQAAVSVKNPTVSGAPFDRPAIIPDAVDDRQAVVAYLAAVAHKGIEKVGIQKGETVLVVGVGAVGLSAAQWARIRGCGTLILMDKSAWRLDRASPFADGVIHADASHEAAVEALAELTQGRMADVIIEASGDSAVPNNLRRMVRGGGWTAETDGARIHLQGDYPEPICLTPYQEWFNRNLSISVTCAVLPGGKEAVLEAIESGAFKTDVYWDKEVTPEEACADYADLEANRDTRMKTLIRW